MPQKSKQLRTRWNIGRNAILRAAEVQGQWIGVEREWWWNGFLLSAERKPSQALGGHSGRTRKDRKTRQRLFRSRVRRWPFVLLSQKLTRTPAVRGLKNKCSVAYDAEDSEIAAMDLPAVSAAPAAIPVSPPVGDCCCSHREQARIRPRHGSPWRCETP